MAFFPRGQATCDPGTLLIVGLWGRCDGQPDRRLYGQVSSAPKILPKCLGRSDPMNGDEW